ncbi:MAG: DUF2666 family protein [Candidatus Diapherotrites archaeon]|nr:DUF2666 family protein [Candidatus Diapherotrites archaeon]
MTDQIEFFAQYGKWVAVKKLKIENQSKAEVARFLASVHESIDRKMWEFLDEDIPLGALDEIAVEITGATRKGKKWVTPRLNEERTIEIMARLRSTGTTRKIKQHVKSKELVELAKIYLTRRALEMIGVNLEPDPKVIEKYTTKKELGEV